MANAIVINGRLAGPRSVELDELVSDLNAQVEVIVRSRGQGGAAVESLAEFIRRLPPGTRTRQEIDDQLGRERDVWEGKK